MSTGKPQKSWVDQEQDVQVERKPSLLHERLLLDVGPLVRPGDLPVHEIVVNDDHTWTHTWRWKPFMRRQGTR